MLSLNMTELRIRPPRTKLEMSQAGIEDLAALSMTRKKPVNDVIRYCETTRKV